MNVVLKSDSGASVTADLTVDCGTRELTLSSSGADLVMVSEYDSNNNQVGTSSGDESATLGASGETTNKFSMGVVDGGKVYYGTFSHESVFGPCSGG